MPWQIRVQFLFSELWYPAYAMVMLASVLLPIVALLTDTPWMRLSYLFFLAFAVLLSAIVFSIAAWIRRQGWYRPVDSPLFSWEAGLFHVLRWPWVLAGTIAAVGDSIRGTEFSFTVTPKGRTGAKPLPLIAVAPYLMIAAVSAAATVLISDVGEARGYYWFTLANAVLYTVAAAAVVVLHRRENRAGEPFGITLRIGAAAVAVLAVMIGLGLALRGDDIRGALTWTGEPQPLPPPGDPSEPSVDAGIIDVTTGSVNLGIYDFTGDFAESDRFAIGHHFITWIDADADQIAALVAPDIELGRWPMLTVEPEPLAGAQDTLLADIAAGLYEEQTRAVCTGLAQAGSPAFVRWGHEMEGQTGRYAWATGQPEAFVAAFRRFEAGCRAVLGDDMFMVWSPLGEAGLEEYWPGVDVVDYVGLPVFDFPEYAEAVGGDPDATFDDLFAPRYDRVAGFGKPVMVAEFGSTRVGAEQVDWIDDAFASTPDYPLLRTIVLFQAPDTEGVWGAGVDTPYWRIEPAMLPNGGP
jgi:cellulose synthase (UDP-forming)